MAGCCLVYHFSASSTFVTTSTLGFGSGIGGRITESNETGEMVTLPRLVPSL